MSYVEFLSRWYNLAFLLLGAVGVVVWIASRLPSGRVPGDRGPTVSATLIGTAVIGLTINGAFHDLGLRDPGPRFPVVLATSATVAFVAARLYRRLARRFFPPVRAVEVDAPDLAGEEARVVSKRVGRQPRSGRAQRQSGDVLHLVHCHTAEEEIRFGRTVRLVEFDSAKGSYLIVTSTDA